MVKYYKKHKKLNFRKILRILSIVLIGAGLAIFLYTFIPIFSWQIYFAPIFASQNIQTPIPKTTVLDAREITALIAQAKNNITLDYTNAQNWFPNYNPRGDKKSLINSYSITIDKLGIKNAVVSTSDYDLSKHLVNYLGTSVPPDTGNAVIFGHSTLPQLFDPNNYKTIFANAYKLQVGDEIFVNIGKVSYKYKIFNIIVIEPEDTSVLAQDYTNSFLTLITCTPPGTVWKRLVIKAKLEKI